MYTGARSSTHNSDQLNYLMTQNLLHSTIKLNMQKSIANCFIIGTLPCITLSDTSADTIGAFICQIDSDGDTKSEKPQ